jgi:hypothetical protein
MDAKNREPMSDERACVAKPLRVDELPKAEGATGDREVGVVPCDELEEPACRCAALMQLPC